MLLPPLPPTLTTLATQALRQNKALIGDGGITPAKDVLNAAEVRCEGGPNTPGRGWGWWAPRLGLGKGSEKRRPMLTVLWQVCASASQTNYTQTVKLLKLQAIAGACFNIEGQLPPPSPPAPLPQARDRNRLDRWLDGIAWVGIVAAVLSATGVYCNALTFMLMWLLQVRRVLE